MTVASIANDYSTSVHRAASRPYVDIGDGHRIFVRDWGQGPPVLFLAGWAMDSRGWSPAMTALNAAGLRTIAYDRRGHGRSTDPGVVDYDLLADDLAAVLEAVDLKDVTLVTHSGAAGEALRYLTGYGRRRIARWISVGGTGPKMLASDDDPIGLPPAAANAVIDRMARDLEGWLDENIQPFAPGATPRTEAWLADMALNASRRILLDFQREILNADLRAEAAALDLPVTIIHGDRDASAPIDLTARRYAELIPGAELVIYEGVAHGIMVTDARRLAEDIARRALP